MKINFSIVIPTLKREQYVLNLLDSLYKKIGNKTEIIVVEQVENHKKIFEEKARRLKYNFKYLFLEKPSTPHAKNIGVSLAKGRFVVFFDDDVLVRTSPELYETCFTKNSVAAISGRSLAMGQEEEPKRRNTGKISLFGNFSDGYSSRIKQSIDTVIGCNACWDKNIFKILGGFDEQFTGNAIREESDLCLRAKEKGYRILFNPRVEVYHVRANSGGARKTEGRLQWYFDFFSNETYFFLKHRPFFLIPVIIMTRIEWALRCMFGFGREVSLRSFITPFTGIRNGYQKYKKYRQK